MNRLPVSEQLDRMRRVFPEAKLDLFYDQLSRAEVMRWEVPVGSSSFASAEVYIPLRDFNSAQCDQIVEQQFRTTVHKLVDSIISRK